jgi:hypothetical protein
LRLLSCKLKAPLKNSMGFLGEGVAAQAFFEHPNDGRQAVIRQFLSWFPQCHAEFVLLTESESPGDAFFCPKRNDGSAMPPPFA